MTKRNTVDAAEEILGLYFPILDHGFMSLKDYMGGDEAIEEAARCSYQKGTRARNDRRGLIRSLMRRGHTSPFEHTELKFHCCMPIFVARQWIRHRMVSVNEVSGRYSILHMKFYTPEPQNICRQSKTDKQGRAEPVDEAVRMRLVDSMAATRVQTATTYEWACENDVARELARIDLPLSTYTQWYWKIDGHNLFHALRLRCDPHAQWETRQYFNWMAGAAKRVMPLAFEAWEDYVFYAKKFSRQELSSIRQIVAEGKVPSADMLSELSQTERKEFGDKLRDEQVVSFDLDLSQGRTPEEMGLQTSSRR